MAKTSKAELAAVEPYRTGSGPWGAGSIPPGLHFCQPAGSAAPLAFRRHFSWCCSFAGLLALALFSNSLLFCAPQDSRSTSPADDRFIRLLSESALEQTHHPVRYDGSYVRIPYPGGDVPADTGVCTDVLIRAYRAAGVDLQKAVHEDMLKNLSAYPERWHSPIPRTDTNIDHRRVPNLMVFFRRKGESLVPTSRSDDYLPGDVIVWNLGGGILHVGLVVDRKSQQGERWMIVHNIGQGPKLEDVLFNWKVIGHYRYFGSK